MRINIKPTILGCAATVCALAINFALSVPQRAQAADLIAQPQARAGSTHQALVLDGRPERGQKLFLRNCAHCHGDDARGDEGPSLYNLALNDAKIAKRIREGIKGEMPAFGSKLNDADVQALIGFLRTLKE